MITLGIQLTNKKSYKKNKENKLPQKKIVTQSIIYGYHTQKKKKEASKQRRKKENNFINKIANN